MTRQEQATGKHGEILAANVLRGLGVEMVERIGTPVSLIPHPRIPGYFRVIYAETVSGDHRGILPGGRSVLVEVKTILDRNLRYSDLRLHQPDRLSEHSNYGGLSILVWVHSSGVYPMQWPIAGFTARKSISVEMAEQRTIYGLRIAGYV